MFNSKIIYKKDYLYVVIEGNATNNDIRNLKIRIYHAIRQYGIYNIVIDMKKAYNVDSDTFYEFINKYYLGLNQSLEIIEL